LSGILLVQQQPVLPALDWAWLLLPIGFLALRWPRAALPLLFFLAGMVWVSFRAGLVLNQSLPPELEGRDLVVTGRIADLPSPTERGLRFRFEIEESLLDGDRVNVPSRVQLHWGGTVPALTAGDQWQFTVRLRQSHGFQNPGSFDREGYLFQQRVRATGYVREREFRNKLSSLPDDWREGLYPGYRLHRFRQTLSARIQEQLPGNPFAFMVTAFANGDDDAIPDTQWEVLNRTGTSHLIAISGMNIGFVAGLAYFLMRRLWSLSVRAVIWKPAPQVAAWTAMLAALVYAALAGFAIPTVRALIMLSVVMGGFLFGAAFAPSVLLAAALLAVLLWDPLSVMAAGFWLSFAAVAIILYAMTGMDRQSVLARLSAWGRLQWAIALALFPVLLFLFQQASLIGPVANLIAIPVVELVVIPSTLIGVLGDFLSPGDVATWPLRLAALALSWLWPALVWMADLPDVIWMQHKPPVWAMAMAVLGALLLLAPRGIPARWLGIVWLLPLFLVRPDHPNTGEARVTLLDVGQGLAVVVQTASHSMVFDTGPRFSSRFDTGRAVVTPFLRSTGMTQIDLLVVSHGDNDHIGGVNSVRQAIPVRRILSSVPERIPGAEACQAGQHWVWDQVRFEMLNPDPGVHTKGNNRSCVLLVVTAHGRALLPGDIARATERKLVRQHAAKLPADVLIAPHHGSKTSSSVSFLSAVRPRFVLLPVGYRNRYRHPHPEVVARYQALGAELFSTASSGAIEIRFEPERILVDRYRESHRRYWHWL